MDRDETEWDGKEYEAAVGLMLMAFLGVADRFRRTFDDILYLDPFHA